MRYINLRLTYLLTYLLTYFTDMLGCLVKCYYYLMHVLVVWLCVVLDLRSVGCGFDSKPL